MIFGSLDVAITFGLYATLTAMISVWLWDTVAFWFTDRIVNTTLRDKEPKGIWPALAVATIMVVITYIFAYANVYYSTLYYVWIAIWFFLALFLIKVTYFPDVQGMGAWGAAIIFTVVVAAATVFGLWLAAYIVVGLELAGLSAAYSAMAITAGLILIIFVLMIMDKRRAEKLVSTAIGYTESLMDSDQYY